MARIRTIKPEFFQDGELFDAEMETGLPLRVAFPGLWTQADRRGRFEWKPRELKLGVLPYDNLDFSRVLDALATRGFIVKYEADGKVLGAIRTFERHQVINNREQESELPPPPKKQVQKNTREARDNDASATREARETHAASGEGKGKEGKGRERKDTSSRSSEIVEPPPPEESRVCSSNGKGSPEEDAEILAAQERLEQRRREWEAEHGSSNGFAPVATEVRKVVPRTRRAK